MGEERKKREIDRAEEGDVLDAVREALLADLRELRSAVVACGACAEGGAGVPGRGRPGAGIMLLSGMPGPGAVPENPWGEWREALLERVAGEWGWDLDDAYYTTAVRCGMKRIGRRQVRRCAGMLAEEFFIVGPRLVIASGKVAAVALREALGDEVPAEPRAGDVCDLFSARVLFVLDIARIEGDRKSAAVFWNILRRAEEIYPGLRGG